MPAPALLFDESAAMDALRVFVRTSVPEVPEVDVYRVKPSSVPGKWGLSVLLAPVNPLPVFAESYTGEENTAKQAQRILVTITTGAAGAWALQVLGESAPFVAPADATAAEVRDGLSDAVDALALAVTTTDQGAASFDVLSNTIGVSLGIRATAIPVGGAIAIAVVDDNLRRAVYNWGTWTVRVIVRDIPSAGGERPSMVGPYCERLRLYMQGSSIPTTNGLAYPYVRDRVAAGRLNWRRTLGPFDASILDNGVHVRGAALDFVFDVPSALLHDIPSLDTISGEFGALTDA